MNKWKEWSDYIPPNMPLYLAVYEFYVDGFVLWYREK